MQMTTIVHDFLVASSAPFFAALTKHKAAERRRLTLHIQGKGRIVCIACTRSRSCLLSYLVQHFSKLNLANSACLADVYTRLHIKRPSESIRHACLLAEQVSGAGDPSRFEDSAPDRKKGQEQPGPRSAQCIFFTSTRPPR